MCFWIGIFWDGNQINLTETFVGICWICLGKKEQTMHQWWAFVSQKSWFSDLLVKATHITIYIKHSTCVTTVITCVAGGAQISPIFFLWSRRVLNVLQVEDEHPCSWYQLIFNRYPGYTGPSLTTQPSDCSFQHFVCKVDKVPFPELSLWHDRLFSRLQMTNLMWRNFPEMLSLHNVEYLHCSNFEVGELSVFFRFVRCMEPWLEKEENALKFSHWDSVMGFQPGCLYKGHRWL